MATPAHQGRLPSPDELAVVLVVGTTGATVTVAVRLDWVTVAVCVCVTVSAGVVTVRAGVVTVDVTVAIAAVHGTAAGASAAPPTSAAANISLARRAEPGIASSSMGRRPAPHHPKRVSTGRSARLAPMSAAQRGGRTVTR
jgi:hypothetical protein